MWRESRWATLATKMRFGIAGMMVALCLACGWAQNGDGTPMVVFLEPAEGSTIPANVDSVQIRFRLISPDNTNLMRYQPFINGLPGNEPIAIEPPSPQVELTILWRGVRQFPDGVHIITIKVVDAKGREGMGSLTLYKGRDSTKPTAEILTPKSGDVVRGEVPILVRVSDDRGIKAVAVSATQRETSKTHTIYLAAGNYGRFMEIRVVWNTAEKHPVTKEDLFPDGVYLLQAKVHDSEGNEGVSSEVLVIVQNKVAQPVISQVTPGQATRGGAMPPVALNVPQTTMESQKANLTVETPLTAVAGQLVIGLQEPKEVQPQPIIPSQPIRVRPLLPEGQTKLSAGEIELPLPSSQKQMQIAVISPVLQPRLNLALSTPETAGQSAQVEVSVQRSDLPLPRVAGAIATSRPSLSLSTGESRIAETPVKSLPSNLPIATPKVVSPVRAPISAPAGQVKLASVWLPPSTSTLRRAPEVPETPAIVPPVSVPRLPEPEVRSQKQTAPRMPRPSFTLQPAHSFRYTVIAGDTLYSLAEKFGINVKELAEVNGLPENAPLRVGQRLIIPARPVTVLVDGKQAQCEVPAFIREGIAVGSFRAVIEASGGIVGWDNERKQAIANLGNLSIVATIGEKTLNVNGERVPLSIAPFLLRNRTFLSLRELGVSLGKEVRWHAGNLLMETPKK